MAAIGAVFCTVFFRVKFSVRVTLTPLNFRQERGFSAIDLLSGIVNQMLAVRWYFQEPVDTTAHGNTGDKGTHSLAAMWCRQAMQMISLRASPQWHCRRG